MDDQPLVQPFFKGPFIGLPVLWDTVAADKFEQELNEKLLDVEDSDLRERLRSLFNDPSTVGVMRSVFSNSPFLTRCALSDLPFLRLALELGPDTGLNHVIDALKDELAREVDTDRLKRGLRIARKRVALLVALADITGTWSLEPATTTRRSHKQRRLAAPTTTTARPPFIPAPMRSRRTSSPRPCWGYRDMEYSLSDEQRLFRSSVERFLAEHYDFPSRLKIIVEGLGYREAVQGTNHLCVYGR